MYDALLIGAYPHRLIAVADNGGNLCCLQRTDVLAFEVYASSIGPQHAQTFPRADEKPALWVAVDAIYAIVGQPRCIALVVLTYNLTFVQYDDSVPQCTQKNGVGR